MYMCHCTAPNFKRIYNAFIIELLIMIVKGINYILLSWNIQCYFDLIRPASPPVCMCTCYCCCRSFICSVPTRSTWSMSVDDYQSYWLKGSLPFMDIAVYSDTLDKHYRCIGFIQTIIIKFSFVIKSCKHSYPLTLIIKPEINFLEILCILMTFISVKGIKLPQNSGNTLCSNVVWISCSPTSSLAF